MQISFANYSCYSTYTIFFEIKRMIVKIRLKKPKTIDECDKLTINGKQEIFGFCLRSPLYVTCVCPLVRKLYVWDHQYSVKVLRVRFRRQVSVCGF